MPRICCSRENINAKLAIGRVLFVLLSIASLSCLPVSSFSAETESAASEEFVDSAPRIFIDCGYCDLTFYREELTFVNFVRDPSLADVHIIVTTQMTSSRGEEFTLEFIGSGQFAGMKDTLTYVSHAGDTDDSERRGLVKILRMGLVRYVARTPVGSDIDISYNSAVDRNDVKDKWNNWVFSAPGAGIYAGSADLQKLERLDQRVGPTSYRKK